VLGDHAGTAAVGAVELHQLEVEEGRDLRHGAVQLGCESPGHTPGPISQLHSVSSPAISPMM
jgi:hypothetical protein